MPFGLTNAPRVPRNFSKFEFLGKLLLAFFNDILIHSKNDMLRIKKNLQPRIMITLKKGMLVELRMMEKLENSMKIHLKEKAQKQGRTKG